MANYTDGQLHLVKELEQAHKLVIKYDKQMQDHVRAGGEIDPKLLQKIVDWEQECIVLAMGLENKGVKDHWLVKRYGR